MELGLFDEASEKLSRAVASDDSQVKTVSAYGLGACLLSMAKRDCQDGKAGAAYRHLINGVENCKQIGGGGQFACVQKLVGDIHSFGAMLPPDVFLDPASDSDTSQEERKVRAQLAFVDAGVDPYRSAEQSVQGSDEEERTVLQACIVADLGSNLLLQGQLLSFAQGKGLGLSSPEAEELYKRAGTEFQRALQLCPEYAPAWCGLGCAVATSDPLLAQHAFCRSIELDNLFPDPYANLSFLYTESGLLDRSGSVSDALTQVADTPMMWINRALMLERQAAGVVGVAGVAGTGERTILSVENLRQAADAYRAALQVSALPIAKKGLAMACRAGPSAEGGDGSGEDDRRSLEESDCLLSEYLNATGKVDIPSRIYSGISRMEGGAALPTQQSDNVVSEGRSQVMDALNALQGLQREDYEGRIDLEPFRSCVALAATDATTASEGDATTAAAPTANLARQVLYEPDRGDLWLSLAKELVRQQPNSDQEDEDPTQHNPTALNDAALAARKARKILLDRLKGSVALRGRKGAAAAAAAAAAPASTGGADDAVVRAADVSDALSLQYWLETMTMAAPSSSGVDDGNQKNVDRTAKHDDDEEEEGGKKQLPEPAATGSRGGSCRRASDVQRALILCPNNGLARAIASCGSE